MKLKSLILGSIAAAGMSTAGFAADLGVLTSLDVCDELGLSGLTISSDTNCLQISGSVDYRLRFGNYRNGYDVANAYDGAVDPIGTDSVTFLGEVRDLDWDSRARAYLKAVAASSTDFGTARAVIGLRQVDEWRVQNEGYSNAVAGVPGAVAGGDHTNGIQIEEAYVSVGDSTVLMAGKRKTGAAGSIANIGDDSPYSFLFMSDKIDGGGVLIDADDRRYGGHVIQVSTDLGNGLAASIGLENIDTTSGSNDTNIQVARTRAQDAGTLIGVLQYAGDGVSAHLTGVGYGVLDGNIESYALHAGATGTFDMFKVRAALGYDTNFKYRNYNLFTALASVEGTFDMFKVALSGEIANFNSQTDYTIGGRVSAQVTEGVSINFDAAWFRDAVNTKAAGGQTDSVRLQAEIAAGVTESVTLTAAVGTYLGSGVYNNAFVPVRIDNLTYGKIGATWKPSAEFSTGANLEVNSQGAYRTEFTASKSFN